MTASMGMEAAIRRRLTRRRWRTFHPLLNSLVQGKGGRRDTSLKRASLRLPRFFFFLSYSPTAFLLSPASTARKRPCPRRSPIDFDRLSRPPLKQLRPYGGIRETIKRTILWRKTINSIANMSFLREAEYGKPFNIFLFSVAKHYIT